MVGGDWSGYKDVACLANDAYLPEKAGLKSPFEVIAKPLESAHNKPYIIKLV